MNVEGMRVAKFGLGWAAFADASGFMEHEGNYRAAESVLILASKARLRRGYLQAERGDSTMKDVFCFVDI